MENIDDLMRQKFDSDDPETRFEFQEEYWEQAVALLEQEESRKRRKWWWWALLALLLTLTAGAGIWLLDGAQPSSAAVKNDLNTATHTQNGEKTAPSTEHLSNAEARNTDNPSNNTSSTTASETPGAGTEISSKNGNLAPKSTDIAGNASSQAGVTHTRNKHTTDQSNTTQASEHNRSGAENKNTKASSAKGQTNAYGASGPANEPASASTPKSGADQTREPKKDAAAGTMQDLNPAESDKQGQPDERATDKAGAENAAPALLDLFILPAKRTPLPLKGPATPSGKRLLKPFKTPEKTPAQTPEKRLDGSLILAGSACPASDTLGRWAGLSVGAQLEYRLKRNFSLSMGVQWRFTPGYQAPSDSAAPSYVENLRYSFGYKLESWRRETRGLHQMEIPVALHWTKNKWALGGGMSVSTLFWVQNTNTHIYEGSLETTQKEVKKWVRGSITPYHTLAFAAFADASYQLNNRFTLFTKAQYRFTPMFQSGIKGSGASGLGYLDLGIRFRVF